MSRTAGLLTPSQNHRTLRYRQLRQRRQSVRFTVVYGIDSRLAQTRPLTVYRMPVLDTASTSTVFHIGDYTVGGEDCQYMYGPSDMRY